MCMSKDTRDLGLPCFGFAAFYCLNVEKHLPPPPHTQKIPDSDVQWWGGRGNAFSKQKPAHFQGVHLTAFPAIHTEELQHLGTPTFPEVLFNWAFSTLFLETLELFWHITPTFSQQLTEGCLPKPGSYCGPQRTILHIQKHLSNKTFSVA